MAAEPSLWQDIQQGESKTLELKQQLPKGEQLAKTLIAFANTSGGKLVIGVDDERRIVGIQGDEFELMDQIASRTLDEALQGRSEIRNEIIARVFRALGYIEQWGSGVGRIQQLCREAGCPAPVFKETGDFFDIEFARNAQAVSEDGEGGAIGGATGGAIGGSITQSSLTDRQKKACWR